MSLALILEPQKLFVRDLDFPVLCLLAFSLPSLLRGEDPSDLTA
jgi:hypothetical protein